LVAVKSYNVINIFSSQNLIRSNNPDEHPYQIGITQLNDTKFEISDKPNDGLYFDMDKIPVEAVIRFRKEGDVFCKYGGGTKKLKEYFIDKKIPNTLRDKIPLIATGNEILLIAGVEISDKIKVTKGTKKTAYAKIIE
ncbi:MAG TPA: tRNA lysidine(34) synthetase TilS, partial [Clostridia bacterium]|nr:tRNA lysidine(34) synthetase TilS [Clostridia bacterium]